MIAAIVVFLVVNIVSFAYERPVGWLDTPHGASLAVRKPNSILVHGNEGFSIQNYHFCFCIVSMGDF